MTIDVTLQDDPSANVDTIAQAIKRFRRELDHRLSDRTDDAVKAYQNAMESSATDLTKAEVALASEYQAAYETARSAGLRDLGDVQEAYFDVRLA